MKRFALLILRLRKAQINNLICLSVTCGYFKKGTRMKRIKTYNTDYYNTIGKNPFNDCYICTFIKLIGRFADSYIIKIVH
jgi:hypothetical protein